MEASALDCDLGPLLRTLHFYSESEGGQDPAYIAETAQIPGKRNYEHNPVKVLIKDYQGLESEFSLDVHSFALEPDSYHAGVEEGVDFGQDADIEAKYLPFVERLIMRHVPGAEKVVFFDHTVRRARGTKLPWNHVKKTHVDQSPKGAIGRAQRHLEKEDWETISNGQKRFRIINVWKPLVPVLGHPLAFADTRTLLEDDLVRVRHVYPDYVGETLAVRHRDG
ncbi:methyltransferase [Apiospora marii]|uniref:Methyltransferase n=1 Tax=Apiospora marii TaxID=335849 RepID=A0ABR1QZT5_9PEZI